MTDDYSEVEFYLIDVYGSGKSIPQRKGLGTISVYSIFKVLKEIYENSSDLKYPEELIFSFFIENATALSFYENLGIFKINEFSDGKPGSNLGKSETKFTETEIKSFADEYDNLLKSM